MARGTMRALATHNQPAGMLLRAAATPTCGCSLPCEWTRWQGRFPQCRSASPPLSRCPCASAASAPAGTQTNTTTGRAAIDWRWHSHLASSACPAKRSTPVPLLCARPRCPRGLHAGRGCNNCHGAWSLALTTQTRPRLHCSSSCCGCQRCRGSRRCCRQAPGAGNPCSLCRHAHCPPASMRTMVSPPGRYSMMRYRWSSSCNDAVQWRHTTPLLMPGTGRRKENPKPHCNDRAGTAKHPAMVADTNLHRGVLRERASFCHVLGRPTRPGPCARQACVHAMPTAPAAGSPPRHVRQADLEGVVELDDVGVLHLSKHVALRLDVLNLQARVRAPTGMHTDARWRVSGASQASWRRGVQRVCVCGEGGANGSAGSTCRCTHGLRGKRMRTCCWRLTTGGQRHAGTPFCFAKDARPHPPRIPAPWMQLEPTGACMRVEGRTWPLRSISAFLSFFIAMTLLVVRSRTMRTCGNAGVQVVQVGSHNPNHTWTWGLAKPAGPTNRQACDRSGMRPCS